MSSGGSSLAPSKNEALPILFHDSRILWSSKRKLKTWAGSRQANPPRKDYKMKHTESLAVCEGGGPRLPSGHQLGSYSEEGGKFVWTRKVCNKHLLRFLDAWTLNEGPLRQISSDCVDRIRYVSREGLYEVELAEFQIKATVLRRFACGEDVYALPRSEWAFSPQIHTKPLPLFEESSD